MLSFRIVSIRHQRGAWIAVTKMVRTMRKYPAPVAMGKDDKNNFSSEDLVGPKEEEPQEEKEKKKHTKQISDD